MRERVRGEGLQTREVVRGQLQCLNGQGITARVPPYGKVAGFPVHSKGPLEGKEVDPLRAVKSDLFEGCCDTQVAIWA